MKKILLLFIGFSLFYGCSSRQNNDFELKEKCNKYIDNAEKRYESFTYPDEPYFYLGTYYSKSRNTCISKYETSYDTETKEKLMIYHDELTGEGLGSYNRSKFETEKLRLELEKGLELVK